MTLPVTGARISSVGSETMSAAVREPVPRSRVSRVTGATAVGRGSSWRAPSLFDSWNPTRSTRADGCTRVMPPTVANGTHGSSVTTRTGGGGRVVVVAGGRVVGGRVADVG